MVSKLILYLITSSVQGSHLLGHPFWLCSRAHTSYWRSCEFKSCWVPRSLTNILGHVSLPPLTPWRKCYTYIALHATRVRSKGRASRVSWKKNRSYCFKFLLSVFLKWQFFPKFCTHVLVSLNRLWDKDNDPPPYASIEKHIHISKVAPSQGQSNDSPSQRSLNLN